jgi:phage gp45-like
MRSRQRELGFREYLGTIRGSFAKADDKQMMQTVQITGTYGEQLKDIEHWHQYGFSSVPNDPEEEGKKAAEILSTNIAGSRDHPVVFAIADRRYRPQEFEKGEVALHDHQHQRLHLTKDGIDSATPKKNTMRTVKKGSQTQAKGASTKDTRQQEKSKTSISQDPDAGTIVFSANDDNGASQSSITLKSDGTVEIKGKKFSFDASEEHVIKSPSLYLGDKPGAKLVIRKDDVDSGGDTQIPTTSKVYIA